jgi:tRNA(Arg) A34 adenosine deaminase TadA
VTAPADDPVHEPYVREALALAREAAARGDRPFGSLLVRDETVLMRESNRVVTADDVRRHPELHLAYRACRDLSPAARAETTMYTSTEPCPMCAGGMVEAGFDAVVYSAGSDDLADFADAPAVRSRAVLDGTTTAVVGPVLNEAGRAVHEDHDW